MNVRYAELIDNKSEKDNEEKRQNVMRGSRQSSEPREKLN
jgi:hypothetical protein